MAPTDTGEKHLIKRNTIDDKKKIQLTKIKGNICESITSIHKNLQQICLIVKG